MRRDKLEEAVRRFVFERMDARVEKLRGCALWDLHFGPYGVEYYQETHGLETWPGYSSAVEELENWARDNLSTVWVDAQTMDVIDTEPATADYDSDDLYVFERKDVVRIVFKELVSHGGMSCA